MVIAASERCGSRIVALAHADLLEQWHRGADTLVDVLLTPHRGDGLELGVELDAGL
jgi:hypothetical protein